MAEPSRPDPEPVDGPAPAAVGLIDRLADHVDAAQRRIAPVAFAVAVAKRFSEDRGSQYGALLAYYGFFSVLPLLLLLTTIFDTVLAGNPELKQRVITTITDHFPVSGTTVTDNIGQLQGSGITLLVTALFVLYGALGVVNVAQDALNTMWGVPRFRWPVLWMRTLRSLAVIGIVGLTLLIAMVVGSVLAALDVGGVQRVLTIVVSIAINILALIVCFEVMTTIRLGLRTVLRGAIAGGVGLYAVQVLGTWYMTRVVARAGAFYGVFAAAIGLLVWIGLQARVVLLASEINVVWSKQLWPRSTSGRNLGAADLRALADVVARESLAEHLVIDTHVDAPAAPHVGPQAAPQAASQVEPRP